MNTTLSQQKEVLKLLLFCIITGFACAAIANSLKVLTETYEARLFALTQEHRALCFVFPLAGLTAIYVLRYALFRRKENKGIKEIYDSLKTRHNELPAYKIPSHYINGLLTVAFGGSSGIEVSTVVASASVGAVTQHKAGIHYLFRREMICAGVAAGVTALFGSPIAGILFALEVILKKRAWLPILCTIAAAGTAWLFTLLLHAEPLFVIKTNHWNYMALPWFILLGIIAGFHSAYLTRSVLFFKSRFKAFTKTHEKLLFGAIAISTIVLFFPQLYGDGYHAVRELFQDPDQVGFSYTVLLMFVALLILKPIATSITLASGGDGGIFGPSLFIGAILGLLVAQLLNGWFHLSVIPVNFMVAGMGAVLSASLHAPFTAVFLACGISGNYILLVPVLTACVVAKLVAKTVVPYTVYNYAMVTSKDRADRKRNDAQ